MIIHSVNVFSVNSQFKFKYEHAQKIVCNAIKLFYNPVVWQRQMFKTANVIANSNFLQQGNHCV